MISASEVTKRHELIMSLVAGLSPIIKVWKPNAQLNIDENPCRHGADFFLFWEARQDFTQIYGQSAFFADLSVIKTYFTDKTSFFGDLSVNFWSL